MQNQNLQPTISTELLAQIFSGSEDTGNEMTPTRLFKSSQEHIQCTPSLEKVDQNAQGPEKMTELDQQISTTTDLQSSKDELLFKVEEPSKLPNDLILTKPETMSKPERPQLSNFVKTLIGNFEKELEDLFAEIEAELKKSQEDYQQLQNCAEKLHNKQKFQGILLAFHKETDRL